MSGTRFFVPCVSFRPSPAEVRSVRRRHAAHSGHAQVIGPTCVRERTHTRRRSAMETFEHNNFACNSIAQPFNSLYKRCNSKVAIWSCDSTPGELHAKLRPPRLASTALLETWPCARRRRRSHQQRQSPDLHKRSLIPLPTSTRPWPGTVVIHLPATASFAPTSAHSNTQGPLYAGTTLRATHNFTLTAPIPYLDQALNQLTTSMHGVRLCHKLALHPHSHKEFNFRKATNVNI